MDLNDSKWDILLIFQFLIRILTAWMSRMTLCHPDSDNLL
jgi:hypothetical protein